MKLTCDEATKICDKSQYGEATLWEKIKRGLHIFLCKNCGLYSKQNNIMTKCVEKYNNSMDKKKYFLKEDEKRYMKKEVRAFINKE